MGWRIQIDRAPFREAITALPSQELERLEDELVLLVKRLPQRLRAPFVLRYVHGKTIPDIASQLQISEKRVFLRVKQAIKRIHSGFSDGFEPPELSNPTVGISFFPKEESLIELGSVSGRKWPTAVTWLFQLVRLRRHS
jgi:hypothetical protein